MDSVERLDYFITSLDSALLDFQKSLELEMSSVDQSYVDTIKNGWITKFNMTVELLWKTGKQYLLVQNGIESNSPKSVAKELFNCKVIDETSMLGFLELIDSRNEISHIYKKALFEKVIKALPSQALLISNIASALNPKQ